MGIMAKNMDTTIMGYIGYRIWGTVALGLGLGCRAFDLWSNVLGTAPYSLRPSRSSRHYNAMTVQSTGLTSAFGSRAFQTKHLYRQQHDATFVIGQPSRFNSCHALLRPQ